MIIFAADSKTWISIDINTDTMKVLMINGSPREHGNTARALAEVARTLNEEGVETLIINIGKKAVQGCIACGWCGREGRCTFRDDLYSEVMRAVKDGIDGLIVGSPVYYGQPNGAVMAVLQRAFFSGANVQNKPAAAVAICRRGGATAAYQTINMIFEMMNMPVVTSQYWNIAYGLAPGEVTQDTEGMQTMRTLADNMAWLLKKIHANGNPDYPEREEWQGMNFIR